MKRIRYCLLGALTVAVAACGAEKAANEAQPATKKDQPASKTAAAKCPSFYTQLPVGTPDQTRKVYTCVERYAQLYAKGPDGAEALSKAVIAKCKDTIAQYVDQEAKKAGVAPPYKEAFESWQGHTLPIIAEARARGCYS